MIDLKKILKANEPKESVKETRDIKVELKTEVKNFQILEEEKLNIS